MVGGMNPATPQGLSILHDNRRVMLKWHRLRRRRADPLFGAGNLALGLQLGASMEVDLRVTADGDFAVLHDDVLDDETDGIGPVAIHKRPALAGLHYDDAGVPGVARHGRRLLFLDDLIALLRDAQPQALLQLDIKDDLATIGAKGLGRLADALQGDGLPVIVSGDCNDLILALGQRLPNVARGLEPSFRLMDLFARGDVKGAEALLRAELAGSVQPRMVYLHWTMVLDALDAGLDLVAICRGQGRQVDAWTFTPANPAEGFTETEWHAFSRLLELGVDQITTDEAVATEAAYAKRVGLG